MQLLSAHIDGLSSELRAAVFVLTERVRERERERERPLVPTERQTGWVLWSVSMDAKVSPHGPYSPSGWTLWSVQMGLVASLDGPCG